MPEFRPVPDSPGIWLVWSVDDGRLSSIQRWEEFVQTDACLELRRVPGSGPMPESEFRVWYGPIPRDWQKEVPCA